MPESYLLEHEDDRERKRLTESSLSGRQTVRKTLWFFRSPLDQACRFRNGATAIAFREIEAMAGTDP